MTASRSRSHSRHPNESRESFKMERSDMSPFRSHLPSNEEDGFYQAFSSQSRWSRLYESIRQILFHRRPFYSYEPARLDPSNDGKTNFYFTGPRLPRKATVYTILKQACLVLPVLVLMTFGIIHVLQVLIGRSSLLWDVNTFHDNFLPNWGKPGHQGEGLAGYPTDATRDIMPIPVHSHNDYWRRIPLFEALHYGCIGVEADVWHFDDDLYVGHNTAALTRNRTFRSLYVDPLIALLDTMNPQTDFVNASKHGVWDTDHEQTLILLVDLKTDGRDTFPIVQEQLEGLRSKGYLTYFNGTHTVPGAITVVGTGNTPFDMVIANTTYRDIFFDAPLDRLWENPKTYLTPEVLDSINVKAGIDYATADEYGDSPDAPSMLEAKSGVLNGLRGRGQGNEGMEDDMPASAFNTSTSYYASVDFQATVGFVWRGHLSSRQIDTIRGQIRGAKKHGLKSRYWNVPNWPIGLRNHLWHVLVREGAEMLNADDLKAAARQDWRRWRHDWW